MKMIAPRKIHCHRRASGSWQFRCLKAAPSKIVCYVAKELMDTENPPLVLPNGYVYSTKALEEMAKRNDGKVTCPRTSLVCNYSELVKAYIS
ncbi:hypothetical protein POPTR_010G213950v4 [Populus trichocarpa]|uniref:Uncharacterized protein n=1 Tax=Populus trichocarpa TaxID=3694 RepID=A0ACC0SES5_POPTR|nr:hypothetical protein POPTR_010G213950v4 [Populus trichocarpa]